MCGIAGLMAARVDARALSRMADALNHRGPDDEGRWVDEGAGIGLAFRRLAILDLSPAGRQPMLSDCGRYVLCFNGEIYNHQALRRNLGGAGRQWRGQSDSETLLAAIADHGIDRALKSARGMFAVALWDRDARTLSLARDRFGEKPLYYGWVDDRFVFASELKAILALGTRPEIDRAAAMAFARRGHVPTPLSIYRGIYKLQPGTMLTVAAGARDPGEPMRPDLAAPGLRQSRYWSIGEIVEAGLADPIRDYPTAVAQLDELLAEVAAMQSIADVPLGAFLSGGIDSSLCVAAMQARTGKRVSTFTIGFADAGYDESPHAAKVAAHLGTDHHTLIVTERDAQAVVPDLATIYDEPFADSSQIPTLLVSTLARRDVTVAISGDGGDELFGGYTRHARLPAITRRIAHVPAAARRAGAALIEGVPLSVWRRAGVGGSLPETKARKLAQLLRAGGALHHAYRQLTDYPLADADADADADAVPTAPAGLNDAERLMYWDSVGYLPDDILVKVDRASMSVSLETRAPLLDAEVAALAWRLPIGFKVGASGGKRILRDVLARHVPRHLFERPKAGFAIPIGAWLGGPLRDWAEALFDTDRLRDAALFDGARVRTMWSDHLAGRADHGGALWVVAMGQAWHERWRGAGVQAADAEVPARPAVGVG